MEKHSVYKGEKEESKILPVQVTVMSILLKGWVKYEKIGESEGMGEKYVDKFGKGMSLC